MVLIVLPARLFHNAGLTALLTGLVVDARAVALLLELEDNATARRAVKEHELAMQEWAARRHDVKPPEEPAEWLVGLPWRLSDDIGTTYVVHSAQAGGSGTEREAQIRWAPAPPPSARRVTIAVRGGAHVTYRNED